MYQGSPSVQAQWKRWHGKWNTRMLTMMALFIALGVILSRFFSINLGPNNRITFGFVPNALAGMLLGPIPAMVVAGTADVIGAVLFPSGAFHPGFTITAMLGGLFYGAFFYQRRLSLSRIILCKLLIIVICNVGLNTFWLHGITGSAIMVLLPARLIKNLAQFPVDVVILVEIARNMERLPAAFKNF